MMNGEETDGGISLGDMEKAFDILAEHRFHTYEGGEGYLTQHHAWLHFLEGRKLRGYNESVRFF